MFLSLKQCVEIFVDLPAATVKTPVVQYKDRITESDSIAVLMEGDCAVRWQHPGIKITAEIANIGISRDHQLTLGKDHKSFLGDSTLSKTKTSQAEDQDKEDRISHG